VIAFVEGVIDACESRSGDNCSIFYVPFISQQYLVNRLKSATYYFSTAEFANSTVIAYANSSDEFVPDMYFRAGGSAYPLSNNSVVADAFVSSRRGNSTYNLETFTNGLWVGVFFLNPPNSTVNLSKLVFVTVTSNLCSPQCTENAVCIPRLDNTCACLDEEKEYPNCTKDITPPSPEPEPNPDKKKWDRVFWISLTVLLLAIILCLCGAVLALAIFRKGKSRNNESFVGDDSVDTSALLSG